MDNIARKSKEAAKARFWAFLVFALPIPTFFLICRFTLVATADELFKLVANPALGIGVGVLLLAVLLGIFRGFRPFDAWHRHGVTDQVEKLQLNLIAFPKKVLVAGLLFGIVTSAVALAFYPAAGERVADFLLIGYANVIFIAMPCYILFLQAFEHWNQTIPFSSKYLSMSLMARVSLVTGFVLTSIFCMVLVAFKNILTEAAQDQSPWSQVLGNGLPIVLIGLVGGVLNIILLMRGIVNRIQRSKEFVLDLARGDVSKPCLALTSRDELGVLADHLNLVHGNLNGLLGSTKLSVSKTVSIKDELVEICGSTAQEIGRIGQQVSLVNGQSQEITDAVERALGRVQNFYKVIGELNQEISRQSEMVQETSSSLEEMTSSIESIARISTSRMQSSQALEGQTSEGQGKMKLTLDHLNQIAGSVEDIRSITGVIQSISAQTNLLSMNAAIEAAHAGAAGAGFAVVADEIRKLAETSSKNSKEITTKVKSIVQMIATAVAAGGETATTFAKIRQELAEFLHSFREIESTMDEMRVGSSAILTASVGLRERSDEVREKSGFMGREADGLFQDMTLLKGKAQTTRDAMTEVSSSVDEVAHASQNLKGHTQLLDQSTQEVSTHVDHFKTLEA